jgi:hypothetical protein
MGTTAGANLFMTAVHQTKNETRAFEADVSKLLHTHGLAPLCAELAHKNFGAAPMNTDPALQDLRPIGRRALISVLRGSRLASHEKHPLTRHSLLALRQRYLCNNCESRVNR